MVAVNNIQLLFSLLETLAYINYHNVYGILQPNLEIYRIKIKRLRETLMISARKSKGDKFEMLNEVLEKGDVEIIKIVHFDMFPLTYVKDEIIYGADGNLVREFCKKYNLNYQIVNRENVQPLQERMRIAFETETDILLTTSIFPVSNKMTGVWLNERDGGCLLVPRNIPVSSIENLTLPFDSLSVTFMALSVVLLTVFWKIIAIVNGKQISAVKIAFDVYQLTFGMGISTLNRLSSKEKFMIMCFMFSSFILATTYQSIILSFMLMSPAMRSARNIQELNASDTKFYMFYDENINHSGGGLFIRRELILNVQNFNEYFDLPLEIDHNLVYFISCKYAKIFVSTKRNFRDGKRLFDRMVISPMLQSYSIRTEFYYKEEFASIVSALTESGIYSFWEHEFINSVNEEEDRNQECDKMIEFHNMKVPFIILSSGYFIALHLFLIEKLIYLFMNRRLKFNRNLSLRNQIKHGKVPKSCDSKLTSLKNISENRNKIIIVKPYVGVQNP